MLRDRAIDNGGAEGRGEQRTSDRGRLGATVQDSGRARAERQRGGLGRALMGEALAQADAVGAPAYLWTANPDNLPYYRSHGFEPFAEEIIPGGVPNWFMERAAVERT